MMKQVKRKLKQSSDFTFNMLLLADDCYKVYGRFLELLLHCQRFSSVNFTQLGQCFVSACQGKRGFLKNNSVLVVALVASFGD